MPIHTQQKASVGKFITSTSESGLGSTKVTARTRLPGQGFPSMMRPVPIVMPEVTQQKQKEGKATCSRKGDSISRRCCRGILLGQGPCELVTSFASRETRCHDVGRAASAQSRPRRSRLLRLQWCRTTRIARCLDKKFWAGRRAKVEAVLAAKTVPGACRTELISD